MADSKPIVSPPPKVPKRGFGKWFGYAIEAGKKASEYLKEKALATKTFFKELAAEAVKGLVKGAAIIGGAAAALWAFTDFFGQSQRDGEKAVQERKIEAGQIGLAMGQKIADEVKACVKRGSVAPGSTCPIKINDPRLGKFEGTATITDITLGPTDAGSVMKIRPTNLVSAVVTAAPGFRTPHPDDPDRPPSTATRYYIKEMPVDK